jgi:D-alanyl-D-alanine carboxypeptidase
MIRSCLRLCAAISLVASAQPIASQVRPDRQAFVRMADSLAASVVQGGVAGLWVAVVKGSDTLLYTGYGKADVENDVAVTPKTVFRIGSVTKQFTAAAVMKLVEEGKVSLDADIRDYLPSLQTHGRKVLIRHLLNHTSGIPSYTDVGPAFGRKITLDLPHDSLLAIVKDMNLMFAPGSGFYYNNTGYYVLGMLIEKVSGMSYRDYVESRLAKPLGMDGTLYCDTRRIIPHRSEGYERQAELVNAAYMSMNLPGAAGALCSTIGDLVAWNRELFSGRIVSRGSLELMTTPVKLASGRPMNYGFGLGRDTLPNGVVRISHGGGINGFISQLDYYPADSLTVVVLANTAPAPATQVAAEIGRMWYGLPRRDAPAPIKDVALGAAERSRFTGVYQVVWPDGVSRRAEVKAAGDSLMFTAESPDSRIGPVRMRSQGGDTFMIPGVPGRVEFDVVRGRATGFFVSRGARSLEATRAP